MRNATWIAYQSCLLKEKNIANKLNANWVRLAEQNKEKIISAVEEQYKKAWDGAVGMRYYVFIDHETGKPRGYEHDNEYLPESVWDGTDPLIAEYVADGDAPTHYAPDALKAEAETDGYGAVIDRLWTDYERPAVESRFAETLKVLKREIAKRKDQSLER